MPQVRQPGGMDPPGPLAMQLMGQPAQQMGQPGPLPMSHNQTARRPVAQATEQPPYTVGSWLKNSALLTDHRAKKNAIRQTADADFEASLEPARERGRLFARLQGGERQLDPQDVLPEPVNQIRQQVGGDLGDRQFRPGLSTRMVGNPAMGGAPLLMGGAAAAEQLSPTRRAPQQVGDYETALATNRQNRGGDGAYEYRGTIVRTAPDGSLVIEGIPQREPTIDQAKLAERRAARLGKNAGAPLAERLAGVQANAKQRASARSARMGRGLGDALGGDGDATEQYLQRVMMGAQNPMMAAKAAEMLQGIQDRRAADRRFAQQDATARFVAEQDTGVRREGLGVQRELGQGDLNIRGRQVDQAGELGQGDLALRRDLGMRGLEIDQNRITSEEDIARAGQDVQRFGIQTGADTARGQQRLSRALGMGQINTDNRRIDVDADIAAARLAQEGELTRGEQSLRRELGQGDLDVRRSQVEQSGELGREELALQRDQQNFQQGIWSDYPQDVQDELASIRQRSVVAQQSGDTQGADRLMRQGWKIMSEHRQAKNQQPGTGGTAARPSVFESLQAGHQDSGLLPERREGERGQLFNRLANSVYALGRDPTREELLAMADDIGMPERELAMHLQENQSTSNAGQLMKDSWLGAAYGMPMLPPIGRVLKETLTSEGREDRRRRNVRGRLGRILSGESIQDETPVWRVGQGRP
jgi:hypothetical protein